MAIPTVNVSAHIEDAEGNPLQNVKINAKLNRSEVDAGIGYVIPEVTSVTTDVNGDATLVIWPNALGATESYYEITIINPTARDITSFTAVIPNNDVNLHDVANLPVYPGKSDGELAADAAAIYFGYAKEWANKAEDSLITADAGGDLVDDYSALHHANKASASAAAALASENAAALSESNAATSEANAATSEINAEAAWDSFDDTYLGEKAADPTLDNDGDPLVEGTLYWNTVTKKHRVYDGAAWSNIVNTSSLRFYTFTATAGQTTFSGLDDDSNLLAYNAGFTSVFLNGRLLPAPDYTASNGSSIILAVGADADDVLSVISYDALVVVDAVLKTGVNASAQMPSGSTAQRDVSPSAGFMRFNTEYGRSEEYNGTSWQGLGGASGAGGDAVFYENDITVSNSYTITSGKNAMSAGPITIANGVTVNVPDGSTWTIVG